MGTLTFASTPIDGQKRVAVITGANSGLGYECARQLLLAGMRVICACRNVEKGNAAVASLLGETASRPAAAAEDVLFMQLDVSSIGSVQQFAAAYKETGLPVHVLLCNAGIMMGPRRESVDGIELQLATNHLGHFELCALLTESLIASAPARVVHVSSIAAYRGRIDVANLNAPALDYDSHGVYSTTKRLQVLFSRALNRRLAPHGVLSHSLEPGVVATNLSTGITDNADFRRRLEQGVSVEEGAHAHVFVCGSGDLTTGGGHWSKEADIRDQVDGWPGIPATREGREEQEESVWAASANLIKTLKKARGL